MAAKKDALSIAGFSVAIEGRTVVDDVTVRVRPGEIVALLGPNGAGKSEFVLAVAGCLPDRTGSVCLGETEIIHHPPEQIRASGVAVVPEGHQVFPGLTVADNLTAAGAMHDGDALGTALQDVYAIFPELQSLRKSRAELLSGGEQQMLALAQAMMCRPGFLLIDELSLGLAPKVIERLLKVIRKLKRQKVGILLIEQFTEIALSLASRAVVMNHGRILFSGTAKQFREQPEKLRNVYLGH